MFPNLFTIGPFTLHSYGLLVAIGFITGITITTKLGKHEGISSEKIMDMGFIIVLSAILGSRLLYVIINSRYFIQNPLEILYIWEGGLVFSGGLLGVILIMIFYTRKHKLSLFKIGDLWAPAIAIGQAIGRLGCLMAGCCYGKPTDLGFGLTFTNPHSLAPLNIPLHPTQLYSAITGFIIFGILMLLYKKRTFNGQVFLWFLILHSTARLFVERFRGDERGIFLNSNMTTTQLVAMLILMASVISLMILKRKNDQR